jgi:hypothetical protein
MQALCDEETIPRPKCKQLLFVIFLIRLDRGGRNTFENVSSKLRANPSMLTYDLNHVVRFV